MALTTDSSAGSLPQPPRTLWQTLAWLGPGFILVGSIVGSGELIATPRLGATAGYTFLWLIILSCVIKVFFQIEIGRYAISTGQTSLEAFKQVALPVGGRSFNWLGWYWFFMVLAAIVQQGAMVGGTAQALRLVFPNAFGQHTETIFAIAAGISASLLLLSGHYGVVEKGSLLLVGAFTILTVYTMFSLQFSPHAMSAEQLIAGFSFQFPSDPEQRQKAIAAALTTFGITGVGASELIAYPYWCLEKGYGRLIGPRDHSESWARRARAWIGVMRLDAWLSMIVFTVATIAFYILAAALLHPGYLAGESLPEESEMIEKLGAMYAGTFGSWSFGLFLVGAIAVLYSTLFVSTAAHARMLTDWFGIIRVIDGNSPETRRFSIAILCVVFPQIATTAYLLTNKPVLLIMISGIMQALMLPMLGSAILFLSYRRTDPRLRGGILWYTALWIALAMVTIVAGYMTYKAVLDNM